MLKVNVLKKKPKLVSVVFVALLAVTMGAYTWHQSTNAALGGLSFEHFATHPYASKTGYDQTSKNYYTGQFLCTDGRTFCPVGQNLTDMGFTADGQLVAGYGDWNSNVDSFGVNDGGVYVVPLDVATNTWGNNPIRAGSEALTVIREIDGAIYAPTTDPSDRTATGQTSSSQSGYITSDGGNWRFVNNNSSNVHTFDIAKRGSDIFTIGAKDWNGGNEGAAVVNRSVDGGVTWTESTADGSSAGNSQGFERYHWGAQLDDKLYVQAASTTPTVPYKIFDGNTWSYAGDQNQKVCDEFTSAWKVVEFGGHIVCAAGSGLKLFDGANSTTRALPYDEGVQDFYVTQDTLYVLTYGKRVYRMATVSQEPELIASISEGVDAYSLAVYGDIMYLGGAEGKIWRSTTTISDAPGIEYYPAVDEVLPFSVALSGGDKTVIIRGSEFGVNPTVKIDAQDVEVVSASEDSITVKFNPDLFTEGYKDIEITHQNGNATTHYNGIRLVSPPPETMPVITGVEPEPSGDGMMRLKVTGTSLTSGRDTDFWSVGMRQRLVNVSGQDIPACMEGSSFEVFEQYYDMTHLSYEAPCYQLIDYDVARNAVTPLLSSTGFMIVLPADHPSAQHGSVKLTGGNYRYTSLNSSNTFTY